MKLKFQHSASGLELVTNNFAIYLVKHNDNSWWIRINLDTICVHSWSFLGDLEQAKKESIRLLRMYVKANISSLQSILLVTKNMTRSDSL